MSRPDDLAIIDAALRGEDDGSELASLVADVRASAPRMSPALERRLDEVGRERPPAAARRRRWWLLAPAGGLAVVAAGVIAVVVAGSKDESVTTFGRAGGAQTSTGVLESVPARPAPPAGARVPRQAAPSAAGVAAPQAAAPRHVEHDVSLTLAASRQDFADVTDGVIHTTDRFDGIVQRSNVEQQGRSSTADFDLRIPTARLDDALATLSRLAHVRARSAGTEDVTGPYNAAAARLADARAERRALLRALARPATPEQVLSLRARLREVRERIGRYRRALDVLRRRTDLARVSVTVVADRGAAAVPGDDGGWTPRDALRDAGRVLEVALGVALVALAALTPLALLVALAVAAARVARRRRREAALG